MYVWMYAFCLFVRASPKPRGCSSGAQGVVLQGARGGPFEGPRGGPARAQGKGASRASPRPREGPFQGPRGDAPPEPKGRDPRGCKGWAHEGRD